MPLRQPPSNPADTFVRYGRRYTAKSLLLFITSLTSTRRSQPRRATRYLNHSSCQSPTRSIRTDRQKRMGRSSACSRREWFMQSRRPMTDTFVSLGMLDSGSPQSPNPGLSRSESLPTTSSPDASLPSKPVPFLASDPVPSAPATVVVQAIGQNGWDGQGEEVSRPRRELSVIEEKDPGLAHSRRSGENDDVGERSISGSVREDNEDISIAGSHEAV